MTGSARKRDQVKRKRSISNYNRYAGVDLCSCGSLMRCEGVCRDKHMQQDHTVKCVCVWRLERPRYKDAIRNKRRHKVSSPERGEKERARERHERSRAY